MKHRIIIGGFGGQGVLFFGKMLAYAGMLEGREVTWFPSYGAEVRGGTANCTVIVSDELIGSPVVNNPDALVVMNDASLEKFQPLLKRDGLLFYDSSLIRDPLLRTDIQVVGVPATEIANRIGNTKSANMVLLGSFIAKTRFLKGDSLLEAVESSVPESRRKIIEQNKKAIHRGIEYIGNTEG
ncbi:MAG: 2-oxoacid:acceptor oxidoreductase family protein [Nitrospirota bacterium]